MGSFTTIVIALAVRTLFLTCRFFVISVRWLVEEVSGINKLRRQSKLPENYYRSAEILTVRGRNILCVSDLRRLSHFILTHDSFTSPIHVLKKDSISLYFLNERVAVFADSGEETPLWDMKWGDFYRLSPFLKATKLVVMPISSFLRLSKTINDPRGEVVFIGNVTRCGSTLLMHMFDKTGQCSTFSEPESLNSLAKMTRQERFRTENEKRELFQATIKMECKPLNSGTSAAYVFKMTGSNIFIDTFIMEYFPQGRHLFLYRNMPDVVRSLQQIVSVMPAAITAAYLYGYNSILDRLLDDRFVSSHNPPGITFRGLLEYATLMPMASLKHYLSHISERSTPAFRYEDLMQNPREIVTEIFKLAGLNPECIEKGMSALNFHSQENSPIAPSKLTKPRDARNIIAATCEKMLGRCGLPPLSECEILPGTKCVQDSDQQ